jgi:predicted ATPase
LCGPNGSGKSTVIEAIETFIHGSSRVFKQDEWTRDTAPVILEGGAQAVFIWSMEKNNPRTLTGYDVPTALVARKIWAEERSHGQSNFSTLQEVFDNPNFDVMVLDEPESALDLDGLLWLREKLMSTDKQVILATHNVILLSLAGAADVSVQCFGEDGFHTRLLATYGAACTGSPLPKMKKRLARKDDPAPRTRKKNGGHQAIWH